MVYRMEQNYDVAQKFFIQEKDLLERELPDHHVGFSANAYEFGLIALLEDRLDDSKIQFDGALKHAELAQDFMCIGCALRGLGRYYAVVGNRDEAKKSFLGSIEAFNKIGELKGAKEVREMMAPYL